MVWVSETFIASWPTWVIVAYVGLMLLPADRKQRLLHILIAFDQLAWVVLTLGRGKPDETISAASWRMEQEGKLAGRVLRQIIDALFRPLESDHCRKSFEAEQRGAHLPAAYKELR